MIYPKPNVGYQVSERLSVPGASG